MKPTIDPAGTRLLDAFRADVLHGAPLPCTAIHPDDHMLRFMLGQHLGHFEGALDEYLRSGLSAARTMERLLAHWFGDRARNLDLLDFASGFGRVTRHLVPRHSPRKLWVSDIFAEAVEFQQRTFGVHGFVSSDDPARLVCDVTFDCVMVSSLFSHLPASSFDAWLGRLYALVRPGGLLLISVHDRSVRPGADVETGAEGLEFDSLSEIPELGGKRYGTSWVDEPFVRRAVAAATGGASCVRLPRGLWTFQDLYAIGRDRAVEPPPPSGQPLGYLEDATRSADGRQLVLQGWAVDLSGAPLAGIDVRVDGEAMRVPVDLHRHDVAEFFGREDRGHGWSATVTGAAGALPGQSIVSLTAVAADGAEMPFHLGTVEATELAQRLRAEDRSRREHEAQIERLRASEAELSTELALIKAGRYWKLREAWWSLKRGRQSSR